MLLGSATVRVPGVCGELVQGIVQNTYFLVTCPIDFYSKVQVELFEARTDVTGSYDCPKAVNAVRATLEYLNIDGVGAHINIANPIPRSKGMGSSSADVIGAIAATGLALGHELEPTTIGRLAVKEEPTDGVMFPGIALFDHREGLLMEELGMPPPMEIIALDFGGLIDTVEFNREDRRTSWESLVGITDEALQLVRHVINERDPKLIGKGATLSAQANQHILYKPQLQSVIDFSESIAASGVTVGHSGTIKGILLDAKERRGKSVFRKAKDLFRDALSVEHFRLLGGGVHRTA